MNRQQSDNKCLDGRFVVGEMAKVCKYLSRQLEHDIQELVKSRTIQVKAFIPTHNPKKSMELEYRVWVWVIMIAAINFIEPFERLESRSYIAEITTATRKAPTYLSAMLILMDACFRIGGGLIN